MTDLLTPAEPVDPDSGPDTGTDPLDDLLDGDARPLREWFTAAGIDVEALWRLPRWNSGEAIAYRRMPDDLPQRVDRVLADALAKAARLPGGAARLFAYLHYECDACWDISYHFTPMWATLRGARAAWARRPVDDPVERAAAEAFLALIVVLDLEIQVENATTCGQVGETARLCREAAEQARVAAERADALGTADAAVARYVGDWARSCVVYYDAVGKGAGAIADLLAGTGDGLDTAIEALRAGEAELGAGPGEYDDPDASELRAHRFSLQELREVRHRPWLYVDTAQIVYLYPFGLRECDPVDATELAAVSAAGWQLCGVPPVEVHDRFNLDDVWNGSDPAGRRFDGTQIVLPEVTLRGPAVPGGRGPVLATLRAELRLSRLGNHYLRFEGDLVDADPQDVYAALMRAAPEHGDADVRLGEHPRPWARLADLAVDLVEALSGYLGAKMSARPGMYQVLLNVYAASIGTGPAATDRREVRSLAQLTEAVGAAVLSQPVTNMINTLAEWSRYPQPRPDQVIVGATNLRDHVVLRTCNTTVQVAFGLAHWSLGTAGTVAEFAASLEGLFAGWFDDLAEYHRLLRDIRAAEGTETAAALRTRVHAVRADQIRLHKLITEAHSTLALIVSPALVASPVVAEQLVTMVEAAGTSRRAADLERRSGEVLDERLGPLAQQLSEMADEATRRNDERQRARLNAILAIVAAVGFSGLGQIFQSGYQWQGWMRTWLIITVILALALSVGLLAWLLRDRTTMDQPEAGKEGRGATGDS